MEIRPTYYPGGIYTCEQDGGQPMIFVHKVNKSDLSNVSKTEDEYIFFQITDYHHYEEELVLKKDNCFTDLDDDYPGKKSVVNCALQFRIKESDLGKLEVFNYWKYPKQKKQPYCLASDTIYQILEKADSLTPKKELARVWLIKEQGKSNIISIFPEYLHNYNVDKLSEFSDMQKNIYKSAVAAVNDKNKNLVFDNLEKSR